MAWTLTGNDETSTSKPKSNPCLCWLHDRDRPPGIQIQPSPGFTAGVVFGRLPPFPACRSATPARIAVLGIEWFNAAGYDTAVVGGPLISDVLKARGYNVTYAQGCAVSPSCTQYDASTVRLALQGAEHALVVIGRGGIDGEMHDSANMSLFGHQKQLIDDAIAAGSKVTLILLTVNPIDIGFAVDDPAIHAILQAYYPQTYAGEAIVDALLGVISPAGRLPYTWPKDLSLAGYISNYTMTGTEKTYRYRSSAATAVNTLWSFGYGLSYSRFRYNNVSVSTNVVKPCDNVTVRASVSNVGGHDSDEVVQVYASWQLGHGAGAGVVSTPTRQLVGFERVFVPAGTTVELSIVIGAAQLAVLNSTGGFVPKPTPKGLPPFQPCDGTTGACGLLKGINSYSPSSTAQVRTLDECCKSCQNITGAAAGTKPCVSWTLVGDDLVCGGQNKTCNCWLHSSLDGYTPNSGGTVPGVVMTGCRHSHRAQNRA